MKAYEVIDKENKWCQGAYHLQATDQRCVVGAISKAYGLPVEVAEGVWSEFSDARLCLKVQQLYDRANGNIIAWNDKHTWEEVYNTLKELDL